MNESIQSALAKYNHAVEQLAGYAYSLADIIRRTGNSNGLPSIGDTEKEAALAKQRLGVHTRFVAEKRAALEAALEANG